MSDDARRCPFCDFVAYSTAAEVAHMETRHREIVAQRLAYAGFDAPTFRPLAAEVERLRDYAEQLAAEGDELRKEVDRVRAEIGPARGPASST